MQALFLFLILKMHHYYQLMVLGILKVVWGYGENNVIKPNGKILFPHSLGIFYLSITQFLDLIIMGRI